MSGERVLNALVNLGLSETDSKVYIYLATHGPQEPRNIADTLKLKEELLRKALENLKDKGIVTFALEQSTLFFALPFNAALEVLMKAHLKEAQEMELSKGEILSKWQKMMRGMP